MLELFVSFEVYCDVLNVCFVIYFYFSVSDVCEFGEDVFEILFILSINVLLIC